MRKFLTGMFCGLMAGWVAGILLAPQPGKETMESLGERALELKARATRKVDQACEDIVLDC